MNRPQSTLSNPVSSIWLSSNRVVIHPIFWIASGIGMDWNASVRVAFLPSWDSNNTCETVRFDRQNTQAIHRIWCSYRWRGGSGAGGQSIANSEANRRLGDSAVTSPTRPPDAEMRRFRRHPRRLIRMTRILWNATHQPDGVVLDSSNGRRLSFQILPSTLQLPPPLPSSLPDAFLLWWIVWDVPAMEMGMGFRRHWRPPPSTGSICLRSNSRRPFLKDRLLLKQIFQSTAKDIFPFWDSSFNRLWAKSPRPISNLIQSRTIQKNPTTWNRQSRISKISKTHTHTHTYTNRHWKREALEFQRISKNLKISPRESRNTPEIENVSFLLFSFFLKSCRIPRESLKIPQSSKIIPKESPNIPEESQERLFFK